MKSDVSQWTEWIQNSFSQSEWIRDPERSNKKKKFTNQTRLCIRLTQVDLGIHPELFLSLNRKWD